MQSAILWYSTFKDCLSDLGFTTNKYDPCVANAIIEGKQCTICWYVDDSKISHVNPKVVDWVIMKLEEQFGKMKVKRGKLHTFVGMDIEMKGNKTVEISMKDYIRENFDVFELFEDKINKEATSAAKNNLFKLTKESKLLFKDKNEGFQYIVYKLLYVSKRARLDIDLAISFLCTRVTCSTDEDWEKLRRLLHYLYGTIDLERIIGVGKGGLGTILTWVDASYATHFDIC